MNTAVAFFSRTGNTKKIAQAIAEAACCTAQDIAAFDAQDTVDLLFIGGAIYGGALEPSLAEFIARLNPEKIGRAAVFSTSASKTRYGVAVNLIRNALKDRGIPTADDSFCCRGKFLFMGRKHPNDADLGDAKQFAVSMTGRYSQ